MSGSAQLNITYITDRSPSSAAALNGMLNPCIEEADIFTIADQQINLAKSKEPKSCNKHVAGAVMNSVAFVDATSE